MEPPEKRPGGNSNNRELLFLRVPGVRLSLRLKAATVIHQVPRTNLVALAIASLQYILAQIQFLACDGSGGVISCVLSYPTQSLLRIGVTVSVI